MKNPKLSKSTRDGIYSIQYYKNHMRKFKSLGTKDKIQAEILFTKLTGFPVPIFTQPKSAHDGPERYLYVNAVNKFVLSEWGIKDGWYAKKKPNCQYRPALMSLYILKRLQKFGRITYLDMVNYDKLQGFMASLRDGGGKMKPLKPLTINKHIARIKLFLDYCVNWEYIRINHANKLKTYKCETPERYSFSKDKIEMILDNCKPRYKLFFELMLETGLRPNDMWNLTQDNFRRGKEKMELHVKIGKTGKWLRVPISDRAKKIVTGLPYRFFPWTDKSWTRDRGEMDGRVEALNELVICFSGDREDGCIVRGRTFCRPLGIRLHTFRHTFAMWKLAAGCPMEVIKDLLGHSDLRMAEVYASSMPKSALAKWV